jgi:protein-S-isoprenylcysteine O-methyltransferase Ste14
LSRGKAHGIDEPAGPLPAAKQIAARTRVRLRCARGASWLACCDRPVLAVADSVVLVRRASASEFLAAASKSQLHHRTSAFLVASDRGHRVASPELFRRNRPPLSSIVAGLALLILEAWILWRVKRDLGGARLMGKTELTGGGQVAQGGIYAHIRHPRYLGSSLAILGACLLGGTGAMWIAAAVWCVLTLGTIWFEERELRTRFGANYEEYCHRVPRFLPLRSSSGGASGLYR